MSGQSRHMSLLEAVVNTLAGIGVAIVAQILIFPLFGIHIDFTDTSLIAIIFTGISLVRSYLLRRVFNYVSVRGR